MLTKYASHVIGVEVDERLVKLSRIICGDNYNLDLVLGDALELVPVIRVDTLFSNAPYHITGPLLASIARNNFITKSLIVLQREVALRLTAEPGEEEYGRLTVLMQLLFDIKPLFVIPASHFHPQPEVDSMALILKRIDQYRTMHSALEEVTRCMFTYRNKLVSKALKKCFNEEVYREVAQVVPVNLRVRQLSPEHFLEITRVAMKLRRK